jgi:hypothetical protein
MWKSLERVRINWWNFWTKIEKKTSEAAHKFEVASNVNAAKHPDLIAAKKSRTYLMRLCM